MSAASVLLKIEVDALEEAVAGRKKLEAETLRKDIPPPTPPEPLPTMDEARRSR